MLAYFQSLSTSTMVLYLAMAILAVVVILYFVPFSGRKNSDADRKDSKGRNQSGGRKGNRGWSHKKNSSHDSRKGGDQDKDRGGRGGLFGSRNKNGAARRHRGLFGRGDDDDKSLTSKMDFLSSNKENATEFTHPKATDSFNELVKKVQPKDIKGGDFDDMDRIFSTMIKAGAVTGRKFLVTNFEHSYLEKLRIWFGHQYYVYCQVSVGSALGINVDVSDLSVQERRTFGQKCHNMSFDFVLVEKATDRIVCAIELDDPTHLNADRKLRDRRLDRVCTAAGLPIFHITNIYQKPDIRRL